MKNAKSIHPTNKSDNKVDKSKTNAEILINKLEDDIATRFEKRIEQSVEIAKFQGNILLAESNNQGMAVFVLGDNLISYTRSFHSDKVEFVNLTIEEKIVNIALSNFNDNIYIYTQGKTIKIIEPGAEKPKDFSQRTFEDVKKLKFFSLKKKSTNNEGEKPVTVETPTQVFGLLTNQGLEIYNLDNPNADKAEKSILNVKDFKLDANGTISLVFDVGNKLMIRVYRDNLDLHLLQFDTFTSTMDFNRFNYFISEAKDEMQLWVPQENYVECVRIVTENGYPKIFTKKLNLDGVESILMTEGNRLIFMNKIIGKIQEVILSAELITKKDQHLSVMTWNTNHTFVSKIKNKRKYLLKNNDSVHLLELRHKAETPLYTHRSAVELVRVSPKNNFLATCSKDELKIWNLHDMKDPKSEAISNIKSFAFAPTESSIIIFTDVAMKKYDLASNKMQDLSSNIQDLNTSLMEIFFDESFLISTSLKEFKIWDFKTGRLNDFKYDQNIDKDSKVEQDSKAVSIKKDSSQEKDPAIKALAVGNMKNYFATACDTLNIWSLNTARPLHSLPNANYSQIISLKISSDDKILYSTSKNGRIKIWNIETGISLHNVMTQVSETTTATISYHHNMALLAGKNHMYIYDTKTDKLNFHFKDTVDTKINSLSHTDDFKIFYSGAEDGSVRRWDFEMQPNFRNEEVHNKKEVRGLSLNFDETRLVSASTDGKLIEWNLESNTKKEVENVAKDISRVNFSNNSKQFASASKFGIKFNFDETAKCSENVICVAFSKEDKYVFYGTNSGEIGFLKNPEKVKDIMEGSMVEIKRSEKKYLSYRGQLNFNSESRNSDIKHERYVKHIITFHNGEHDIVISSSYKEFIISIFEGEVFKKIHHFEQAHKDLVSYLDVSSDHKLLATASADKSFKVWSLETWQVVHHFKKAHNAYINSVKFTKEGDFIVTASDDKSIKIWNWRIKCMLHEFKNIHNDMIYNAIYNRTNDKMFSSSKDGVVKFTDFKLPEVSIFINGINSLALNLKPEFIDTPEAVILPQAWNMAHYFVLKDPKKLYTIPLNTKFSNMVDMYGKTPLHYYMEIYSMKDIPKQEYN